MRRPDNYFESLAGVKVHYDRLPDAPYGSHGKQYKFYADRQFQQQLDSCFSELWELCPYGIAEVITSAGTFVSKPGFHGKGRAFDLDAIFWNDANLVMNNYHNQSNLYLGIEAVLRKHFGTVLTYLYDSRHRNHIHIDNGNIVKFNRTTTSKVLFVQSMMNNIFDISVTIDGLWGPETESSLGNVKRILEIEGTITDIDTWLTFLTLSSQRAFSNCISNDPFPTEQPPIDLWTK